MKTVACNLFAEEDYLR